MTDDVYYEEELRYLREEGARFARAYPQRARYLNLETVRGAHPRVERLFQGFAFMCAGIRRQLDDGFPELTTGLAEMLWPRALQMVPGLCVVEFKPRVGMLQGAYTIKKGTAMYTAADAASGVVCQFSTTRDVTVNPITLADASLAETAAGKDTLTLTFAIDPGVRFDALRLSPLRIYIRDDLPSALTIRKMLLRDVESVILANDAGERKMLRPQDVFAEGGFDEDDDLFPECQNANRPLEMIRDCFTFPERFLFVDICGLDTLPRGGGQLSKLSLEIRFSKKVPGGRALTKGVLRLHCAPAANVFRRDAEPISVSGDKSEYRLIADAVSPDRYSILSVETVTGINSEDGSRREYRRFGTSSDMRRSYSLRRERARSGDTALLLSMNGRQTKNGRPIQETLHIETWQSNGGLARKMAAVGGLCKPAPDFPEYITFANITAPNNPINPPDDDKYLWLLLSHIACAHTDFHDARKLKEFLYAYNWGAVGTGQKTNDDKKRPEIEAILSVSQKPIDLAVDRAVIRGTEMNVTADEGAAAEETLFLLGTVLARALSCMASINTFFKLTLTLNISGKTYEWYCQGGERCTI